MVFIGISKALLAKETKKHKQKARNISRANRTHSVGIGVGDGVRPKKEKINVLTQNVLSRGH